MTFYKQFFQYFPFLYTYVEYPNLPKLEVRLSQNKYFFQALKSKLHNESYKKLQG